MVTKFAFVDSQFRGAMIILGDFGGELGFFLRRVTDFVNITNPAALGLVL